MADPDNQSPTEGIDAKLKAVAEATGTPPAWYNAWAKLTSQSTDEERLAVYQSIRREKTLPDEASFFLVTKMIDDIATRDADAALLGYEACLKAVEKQYRLDDGSVWASGAAPVGYEELRGQYYRAWDKVFADKLEQFGEREMARLFREDQSGFDQHVDKGRIYFFGPESAAENIPLFWLWRLVDAVAGCMIADSPMGPLGYRWTEEEGHWQIDVYPTSVELIGGAVDGEIVAPDFSLDLEEIRNLFDRVDSIHWQALGLNYPEGAHVSIEGLYQSREVFLQVLAYAPEDEEPGMKLDTKPLKPE